MTRYDHASSVLTLLLLLVSASFLPRSTPHSITVLGEDNTLPGLPGSEKKEDRQEQRQTVLKRPDEEDVELFTGVNPRKLAAVLLEALNQSDPPQARERDDEEHDGVEEEMQDEREKEANRKRIARHRDGHQELLNASQMKDREGDNEEERRKALEEEERLTEKVTSHTSSHTVQVQTQQQPSNLDGAAEHGARSSNPEEEEQLNSEELKSLETVMKEFPRLNMERADDSEQNQRETRSFRSHNDISPIHKGSDLSWSKKKLKWQEETQKALHFPTFTGENSIDESKDRIYNSKATHSTSPAEQELMSDDGSEEEEEDEVLSPEEEEAQAKVEQEEMMRQVAEAQRAKLQEEKLADIASDMLLRYMVKQNNGEKKYPSSLSNAAEDKRSNEEQRVNQEDDIDPQTIDKLIEISSKLHLPADDIVDIITDAEKKKKDMPPEIAPLWNNHPSPQTSSFLPGWQFSNNQNSFSVTKQQSPAANLLQTWFKEKNLEKSDGLPRILSIPSPAYRHFGPKKPLPFKQDRWLKSPKPQWTVYRYQPYPPYYQRNPYPDHYPFYFPLLPRPIPYYYMSKPALPLNNIPGSSVDDTYTFPPRRRYQSWVQPQLRKPPTHFQQKSYFTGYRPPIYSHLFQQTATPREHPPPQTMVVPPRKSLFYTSGLGPAGTKHTGIQPDSSIDDDLEKYIQQILLNKVNEG